MGNLDSQARLDIGKYDITSDGTKTSFSSCCDEMKSAEFLTAEDVFPTSWLRMEERYLDS